MHYYITNNKILNDLPILGIKKRRLQEIMAELEEMKIIYRDFVRRPPPTSTHKAKIQARSAFKDEKQRDVKENEHDFLQLDHQEL